MKHPIGPRFLCEKLAAQRHPFYDLCVHTYYGRRARRDNDTTTKKTSMHNTAPRGAQKTNEQKPARGLSFRVFHSLLAQSRKHHQPIITMHNHIHVPCVRVVRKCTHRREFLRGRRGDRNEAAHSQSPKKQGYYYLASRSECVRKTRALTRERAFSV